MEREKCCCFTGHRRIPEQEMLWVRRRLREEILDLAQKGVDTFLTGGALGFDTLAAQEVLRMRAMGLPSLKLVLALPYMNQEAQWSQRDAAVYRTLLRQADNVVYTSQEYHRGCLFQRNRYLVDHSAYCVCYLLQERTGTSYTAQYARQGRESLSRPGFFAPLGLYQSDGIEDLQLFHRLFAGIEVFPGEKRSNRRKNEFSGFQKLFCKNRPKMLKIQPRYARI